MEKHQHPFDDFLKETLKGHRLVPREEARKAFLDEASTIDHARRGWFRWYYLPLLVAVISSIIILFSYPGNENELPAVAVQNEIPIIEPAASSSSDNQPSTITLKEKTISTTDSIHVKQASGVITASPVPAVESPNKAASTTSIIAPEVNSMALPTSSEPAENKADVMPVSEKPETVVIPESIVTPLSEPVSEQVPLPYSPEVKDTSTAGAPVFEPKGQDPEMIPPGLAFAVGTYYLPEYMFNTVEGGKFVNNFGFDFTFYRGRTSIRTGAGISISQGLSEKAVEYNEFLGTYNKLDSISFTFNESAGDFYPTIHTSSENVWDSLPLYDSTEIIKRYTYLQIPLILGFDFWQKNRLTVGVRIGTIMSVMLKSKQLTGAYESGENQVVGISKLSPDQVSMNWQAVGGINGSLMLTRRLYLEIEPQAKYYYQSIYEKSGYDKKPWSLGLRIALLYEF